MALTVVLVKDGSKVLGASIVNDDVLAGVLEQLRAANPALAIETLRADRVVDVIEAARTLATAEAAVRFETDIFEASHNRKPSRTTYGAWYFEPWTDAKFGRGGDRRFMHVGMLAESKAAARAHFARLGVDRVAVLP